jgi:hypothetical protein
VQLPPVAVAVQTKLALHPQDDPVATPVPLAVGQVKQKADEPVPTTNELVVAQMQEEVPAFHFIVAETQVQVKESALALA